MPAKKAAKKRKPKPTALERVKRRHESIVRKYEQALGSAQAERDSLRAQRTDDAAYFLEQCQRLPATLGEFVETIHAAASRMGAYMPARPPEVIEHAQSATARAREFRI